MAQKLIVPMAQDLVIGDGYILRLSALDQATGADVPGPVISKLNVAGIDIETGQPIDVPPPLLTYDPSN